MEKSKDTLTAGCPVRNILARVGDKWSLLLMHQLGGGGRAMRFTELQKAVPDISQKVLTTTLRTLEADGFVVRTVYAEVPPKTALLQRVRLRGPHLVAIVRRWRQE